MPKSLHTVTVLVNVAILIMDRDGTNAETAIERACCILGYADAPDDYDLAGAALRQFNKANDYNSFSVVEHRL